MKEYKINRKVDETYIDMFKERNIEKVMQTIKDKKSRNIYFNFKTLIATLTIVLTFILGFSIYNNSSVTPPNIGKDTVYADKESFAMISYLSSGLLDISSSSTNLASTSLLYLSDDDEYAIDNEMDSVNIYMDKLKVFMEDGANALGKVTEEVSSKEGYDILLKFTVSNDEYMIYYTLDENTGDIIGLMVLDNLEYELEGFTSLKEEPNKDELDQKMVLTAKSGEDSIEITYKQETETDESTVKFEIDSKIDGKRKESKIKITEELNEYKVDILEEDNEYTFKRETENDGFVYKLTYRVGGVMGSIKIIETTDQAGGLMYEYKISESGKEKSIKKSPPKGNDKGNSNNNENGKKV